MKIKTSLALVIGILSIGSSLVFAEADDKNQTINIWADNFIADKQNNSAIYQGNVKFEQGSIKINTDLLEIFYQEKSFERIIMQSETLSSFEQLDNNKLIKATAKEIIYRNLDNLIIFSGNVTFQEGNNIFKAQTMQLNTETKKLVTTAKPSTPNDNADEDQDRVFISIQPE